MHPDLFSIGPLTIHTYGVAMASSFLIAFLLSARRAAREQLYPETIMDSFLPLFIGAMIGARTLYIITDWGSFANDPIRIFKIWQGGLVFYGGFLGGMTGVLIFVRLRKLSFWRLMDLMAPYAALGYAIHRTFGCFLGNGCCYGKPTGLPWGVLYPENHITRHLFGNHPVHPTQIYESINGLLIMAVLLALRRKDRPIGQRSGIFLVLYSMMRFGVEFLRGDDIRGFYWVFSTSQWVSMVMFVIGVILLLRKTPVVHQLDADEARAFLAKSGKATDKKDSGGSSAAAQDDDSDREAAGK